MPDHIRERQQFLRLTRRVTEFIGTPRSKSSAEEVVKYLTRMYLHDRKSSIADRALRDRHRFRNQPFIQAARTWMSGRPVGAACYWLSSLYAVLTPSNYRLKFAMYFTPPQLGTHTVRLLENRYGTLEKGRIIDPACGGAAFLLPVAAFLRKTLRQEGLSAVEALQHIERNVTGWERDSTLAYLSSTFLQLLLESDSELRGTPFVPDIVVGDTLLRSAEVKESSMFDVVLCNPPYRKVSASELPRYRLKYGNLISGQPNLYALFSAAVLGITRPGGICALLTPTSYLSGDTFAPLRDFMLANSRIDRIETIHEREGVFHQVQQDTVLTLCTKTAIPSLNQHPQISSWTIHGRGQQLGNLNLPSGKSPWNIPRSKEDQKLHHLFQSSVWRLKDYGYRASVGAYVWNRDQRRYLKRRPDTRFHRLRLRTFPIVWASHIRLEGGFQFEARSTKEAKRRFLVLTKDVEPSVRKKPCVLIQRTSSRGQLNRLVAATLPESFIVKHGGFVAENHVIVLEPLTESPLVSLDRLCLLILSKTIQAAYGMASGTSSVTVSELNSLPLPDPKQIANASGLKGEFEAAILRGYEAPRMP